MNPPAQGGGTPWDGRAWDRARKRELREQRQRARGEDPNRPGVLVSLLQACPHGTEYGYTEFICRCVDLGDPIPDPDNPGKFLPWGCQQAGSRAASDRRKRREQDAADGRASGSAIAQLDTHDVMNGHPPDDLSDSRP